jgi:uncharacterized membrane protein
MTRKRQHFLAGLITITPVAVTGWIVWRLYLLIDGALRPLLERILPLQELPDMLVTAFGVVVSVILIFVVGLLAGNLIGRAFFGLVERVMNRIPVIKGIFSSVKQIAEVFLGGSRQAFKKVVLFEYPRRGLWAVGFVTRDEPESGVVHVFLPTTPNPTSGFLLMIPRADATVLDMSVEEGIRLIISGGAAVDAAQAVMLDRSTRVEGPDGGGET